MSQDQENEGEKVDSLQEEIAAQYAEFQNTLDDLADSSECGTESEGCSDRD